MKADSALSLELWLITIDPSCECIHGYFFIAACFSSRGTENSCVVQFHRELDELKSLWLVLNEKSINSHYLFVEDRPNFSFPKKVWKFLDNTEDKIVFSCSGTHAVIDALVCHVHSRYLQF